MKLKGKCKEDFEKWFNKNIKDKQEQLFWLDKFYSLHDSMRYGVYVDFFDSVGIYINISNEAYIDGVNTLWQVFEYDINSKSYWSNNSSCCYGDNGEYNLLEARTQAIKKANEIYNYDTKR